MAANEGRHFCKCGCGEPIPLRPEHFSEGVPNYRHGHNPRPTKPRPRPLPCECGCGGVATPGRRFITGHNGRGRRRPPETRRKISDANKGRPGLSGERSGTWKGGRQAQGQGYFQIVVRDHPFGDTRGRVLEHRLIAEAALREANPDSPYLVDINGVLYISQKADVHHVNEIKDDNRVENLEVMWKGDHTRHHLPAVMAARWPKGKAA
jgi:hypothetical protein